MSSNRTTSGNNDYYWMKDQLVYFIECPEIRAFKIGHTSKLPNRLTQIQLSCPFDLFVRAVVPGGDRNLEAELHTQFRDSHMRGEWFQDSDVIRSYIASNTSAMHVVPTKRGIPRDYRRSKDHR